MENTKSGNKTTTANEENPNIIINQSNVEMVNENGNENDNENRQSSTRTPFTNLSQVDADLALARTLQEQERAYMMLRNGADYGSWEVGSYVHDNDDDFDDPIEDEYEDSDGEDEDEDGDDDIDDDVFDVHAHAEAGEGNNRDVELDPASFPSDEAYARALQDSEEREMASRLLALAGINDMVSGDEELEDDGRNSQDTWVEVDPDELSYEELIALGEIVGTESRGLSADTIASLPSVNYKTQSNQNESNDPCVICRLDYEDGDTVTVLSCKHAYHSECINNWLQINKVCPVCSAEVSTS